MKTSSQPVLVPGAGDFKAALAMIAMLLLSAAEKAEAVRRMLAAANATSIE
jgi:hypothetical protein